MFKSFIYGLFIFNLCNSSDVVYGSNLWVYGRIGYWWVFFMFGCK